MYKPITQTMAGYLKALIASTPCTDERTASVLERREYTVGGVITQLGRETLGQHVLEHAETSPSAVTSCVYWNSFYGWKGYLTYADTPDHRVMIDFKFRLPAYHHNLEVSARRAVLRELIKVRNLSLACAPQPIEEPIDDYEE